MKKILINFILIILITGCSKEEKYANFKHYNLTDKDIISYTYHNKDRYKEIYILADITPDTYESYLTGLFYKVSDNDYILLETLEHTTKDAYKQDYLYTFYDNKLYGVGNGDTPMIFEIELNKENSKLKELEFVVNNHNDIFSMPSIKKIYNNTITFSGYTFINEHAEQKEFICSLNDYICDMK